MSWKLYDILGINKSSSIDDIKKAYKKLAIQYHPDKGGDPEKFKEITNAYKILSDSTQKEKYDNLGDDMYNNIEGSGFDSDIFANMDIFNQFFGNNSFGGFNMQFGMDHTRGKSKKCNDYIHTIDITNKEVYFGYEKNLNISINKKCFKCINVCDLCNGRGTIQQVNNNGLFRQIFMNQCNKCNGSCNIFIKNINCNDCKGNSTIKIDKIINIKVPRGSENGYSITFDEMGEQPSRKNDIAGNLIIIINIKESDSFFTRKGLNLYYNLNISFKESLIGKEIIIPHYESDINFNIKELGIIDPNHEYHLKEKGMIDKNNKKGDLVLKFNINYPNIKLNEQQINLIKDIF